jgi:hypothetical protein
MEKERLGGGMGMRDERGGMSKGGLRVGRGEKDNEEEEEEQK